MYLIPPIFRIPALKGYISGTKEAMYKFKDMDIPLMETSALEDTNVNEAFIDLIKIIYQDYIKKGERICQQY